MGKIILAGGVSSKSSSSYEDFIEKLKIVEMSTSVKDECMSISSNIDLIGGEKISLLSKMNEEES